MTESRLWTVLLAIATGRASAYTAISQFMFTVPWEELDGLSSSDRDLFKLGMLLLTQ